MKELFYHDAAVFFQGMPLGLFVGLGSILFFGTVVLCISQGFKEGVRLLTGLLLLEYVTLFFCSAVLYRPSDYPWEHHLTPFWSYAKMLGGRKDLIADTFYNVLVFLPIGFLLKMMEPSMRWWKVLLISLSLSFLIEGLQYELNKGFCEFDDVFHNVVGAMTGYYVCSLVIKTCRGQFES